MNIKKIGVWWCIFSFLYLGAEEWAVIGAGPAGILAVSLLRDNGTSDQEIIWVDPDFCVGRFGKYYTQVPPNTPFTGYFSISPTLQTIAKGYAVSHGYVSLIDDVVHPLQVVTEQLRHTIHTVQGKVRALYRDSDGWRIGTDQGCLSAHKVILAIGWHPRRLGYICRGEIPLDYALNKKMLSSYVKGDDTIAVIGNGTSAILVMQSLTELSVKKVINLYYAPDVARYLYDDWMEPDSADRASDQILSSFEITLKKSSTIFVRLPNTVNNRQQLLPECTKIIYAVGFERNKIPLIYENPLLTQNSLGMIAPGLFGLGISFPATYGASLDGVAYYAQRMVPQWIRYICQ